MISDSGYILELNVVSFIYAMFIFILKSEVKLFNFLLWWKLLILLCTLPIFYCRRLHSIPGRSWMFDGDTQCTNHQLELAMKDVFLADAAFKEFDKVLLEMYLVTHDKVKQLLKSIAMRLNVMYVAFVKSDGTRFQNHKYRAIKALIMNYIPMPLLMENYIAVGSEVLYTCTIILLCVSLHFILSLSNKNPGYEVVWYTLFIVISFAFMRAHKM